MNFDLLVELFNTQGPKVHLKSELGKYEKVFQVPGVGSFTFVAEDIDSISNRIGPPDWIIDIITRSLGTIPENAKIYQVSFFSNNLGDNISEFSIWEVTFHIHSSNSPATSEKDPLSVTGTVGSKSTKVFSVVAQLIEQFVGMKSPDIIFFTSSALSPSRQSLYATGLPHLARKLGFKNLPPKTMADKTWYTMYNPRIEG